MTTTNTPAKVRNAPNANGSATDAPRTRVTTRRGNETKAFYKTTKCMVFIVATVGFCLPRTWFRRPTGAATISWPIRRGCMS
jgi:hypothetical protein